MRLAICGDGLLEKIQWKTYDVCRGLTSTLFFCRMPRICHIVIEKKISIDISINLSQTIGLYTHYNCLFIVLFLSEQQKKKSLNANLY